LRVRFFTAACYTQGTYFRWHNLAIGLQRLGHDISVHSIGPPGSAVETTSRNGIPYYLLLGSPLGARLLGSPYDPIAALRTLLPGPEPADIFHLFQPFPLSCLGPWFHQRRTHALVFDWDDLWWQGLLQPPPAARSRVGLAARLTRWLEHHLPRRARLVTTCSAYLADLARDRSAPATQVIHNGYWPDRPFPEPHAARLELGLDPAAFYFGFMGRTVSEFEWCLDPLALDTLLGSPVRLALCGMSPDLLASLAPSLRARVDYLGQLTPDQTRLFARGIDCGLLPLEDTAFNQSRFPIKFAEYLAAGAHVVASTVGECAALARQIPAVTLAGTDRHAWSACFAPDHAPHFQIQPEAGPGSPLARLLGWDALALNLAQSYETLLP
jgi:glycosyltransferase involved in cell wall biosynthesis